VVVVVPKEVKYTNVSILWMASLDYGCNKDEVIDGINADIELADVFTTDSGTVGVVAF